MSILDTLAHDHRIIEETLSELGVTPHTDGDRRLELFAKLQSLLQAHARAEEEVVYRPLRARQPYETKALEAYEEHHIVDLLMQELGSDCPGDAGWCAKIRVLEEVIRHHVKEEETIVFPMLDENFATHELDAMDAEFRAVKHEGVEKWLGPLRRATPAFAGRATVTVQATGGRMARRGELFLRRRLQRRSRTPTVERTVEG